MKQRQFFISTGLSLCGLIIDKQAPLLIALPICLLLSLLDHWAQMSTSKEHTIQLEKP